MRKAMTHAFPAFQVTCTHHMQNNGDKSWTVLSASLQIYGMKFIMPFSEAMD